MALYLRLVYLQLSLLTQLTCFVAYSFSNNEIALRATLSVLHVLLLLEMNQLNHCQAQYG